MWGGVSGARKSRVGRRTSYVYVVECHLYNFRSYATSSGPRYAVTSSKPIIVVFLRCFGDVSKIFRRCFEEVFKISSTSL